MTKLTREAATEKAAALLKEPYSRILIPDDESGLFAAEVLEFPGCFAQGESPDEAYAKLEVAAEAWLLSVLEQGKDVPRPLTNLDASGKFALRMPRSLYERATKTAARDGVSLNQFIVTAVAEQLGAGIAADAVRQLRHEVSQLRSVIIHQLEAVSASQAVHIGLDVPQFETSALSGKNFYQASTLGRC